MGLSIFKKQLKDILNGIEIYFAKLLNNVETIHTVISIPDVDKHAGLTPELEYITFSDMVDFQKHYKHIVDRRLEIERQLSSKYKIKAPWVLEGYCQCCERNAIFLIDWRYSDGIMPYFRERLVCNYCGLNNRQRFVMGYLRKLIRDKKKILKIYCYEQATHFYSAIVKIFGGIHITGSEYIGQDKKPGEIIGNIRHEDALNLSFDNESFDAILSNDVYEHVPNIQKAFQEAYRCLRKNGILIFTVPFSVNEERTKQRAAVDTEGKVVHILPEWYHGNPFSLKGALVYYDFGWDILTFCKDAGFNKVYIMAAYSLYYGYIGNGFQFVFCAEK